MHKFISVYRLACGDVAGFSYLGCGAKYSGRLRVCGCYTNLICFSLKSPKEEIWITPYLNKHV